jgi:hypothetical protein
MIVGRHAQVIVGLLVGYVVAAVVKYEGKAFISMSKVEAAPAFTFLWVKTFPLGIYPPAILPFLIGPHPSSLFFPLPPLGFDLFWAILPFLIDPLPSSLFIFPATARF